MAIFRRLTALLAGLSGLAGCNDANKITFVNQTNLYSPQMVRASGFRAEIYGAPRAGATLAQTLEGLHAPGWASATPLTPASEPGRHGRLVLIFNPAGSAPSAAMCTNPDDFEGKAQDAPLRVFAAYCMADRLVARGALSAPGIPKANSPGYAEAMNNLFAAMLPPHQPPGNK
ncbi:MAG: hypothetical protein PW790_11985 [Parvibaculaceae bacterium]|nr:hypothetical protein [Parvibaculaceae bacterium]